MLTLFIDTNFFLQCNDISQLHWTDISDGDDITLMISAPVQEEIDKLKSDGNSRRAKRARKANGYLKSIILSESEEEIINEKSPKVLLKFSPIIDNDKKNDINILDLNKPDDRIIFEAIKYRDNTNSETAIFTHDTNPLLTARRMGLKYVAIPDSWLLKIENSKDSKKIQDLEKRIKKLEEVTPDIKITFLSNNKEIKKIIFPVKKYVKLTDNEIDLIINKLTTFYPLLSKNELIEKQKKIKSELSIPNNLGFGINAFRIQKQVLYEPSHDDIDKYVNKLYPDWLKKVRIFLEKSHEMYRKNSIIDVYFLLENIGNLPADGVLVEIMTFNDLKLMPESVDNLDIFPPTPKPPKEPLPEYRNTVTSITPTSMNFLDRLSDLPISKSNHDKNTFYWKYSKPKELTEKYVYECEEFRHQLEPETFNIILSTTNFINIKKSNLQIRISCKNIPKPIIFNTLIELEYTNVNLVDTVLERVNNVAIQA